MTVPFLEEIYTVSERLPADRDYPFSLAFVEKLSLKLTSPVTFLVGENGTGKSTLIEAISRLIGFPAAGGGLQEVGQQFAPEEETKLAFAIRTVFRNRPKDGYFLRAEFLAHFASLLDERMKDPAFNGNPYSRYGGKSLHEQSHGEAFLSVLKNRINRGLYLFDEPEAALSPQRQLALLMLIQRLVREHHSQFIIATHSPILLTFPDSQIVSLDDPRLPTISFEETSHYRLTKGILDDPASYWDKINRQL